MKFHYYAETDSLYIEFSSNPSIDSKEAAPGVVLDFDTEGRLVGIDIDHASTVTSLTRLDVSGLTVSNLSLSQ